MPAEKRIGPGSISSGCSWPKRADQWRLQIGGPRSHLAGAGHPQNLGIPLGISHSWRGAKRLVAPRVRRQWDDTPALCHHEGVAAKRSSPMLGTILLIVLILLLLGALPNWGYSRSWGYGPSGLLGIIILIIIVLWVLGRL